MWGFIIIIIIREKVNIPQLKSFITIQGAGAEKTIVQWGDTAKTPGPRGQPMGTYSSATFAVNSPYFIAKNITFKACNFPHLSLSQSHTHIHILSNFETQNCSMWYRTQHQYQHQEQ